MGLIDLGVPEILNNLKSTGFYLSKKLEKSILENFQDFSSLLQDEGAWQIKISSIAHLSIVLFFIIT
jgi:hypothetical protein